MARERNSTEVPSNAGFLGILARLIWLGFGNGLLVILAAVITQPGATRGTDVLFWLIVACIIVVRYVDVAWLGGVTANGERATMAHWRRHVSVLLPVAAGLWTLAHVAARLVN